MKRPLLKICLFLTLLGVVFGFFCFVFQPIWTSWNNYETLHGFYLEPKNTIETIFLGPSTVVNGISPMDLYEKYGYCTYNLGTEAQPILASYYWLKEAYRLHSDSLKVVFLDSSALRYVQNHSYYQKAIDEMQLSPIKIEAIAAYQRSLNKRIEYTVPLFEYHDRWDGFEDTDDEKYCLKPERTTRGYNLESSLYIDNEAIYQDLDTHLSWYESDSELAMLYDEGLEYFDKMVLFCQEKKIQFILANPVRPTSWDASLHNALSKLSEEYGAPYYDLNASPLLDELGFLMGYDNLDVHLNYYGAVKITDWYGRYLKDHKLNTDITGKAGYEFMEDQLEAYRNLIKRSIAIHNIEDVAEYLLETSKIDHSYVLISAKTEAAEGLTETCRKRFAELGLEGLSELGSRESYIGVLKDGVVDAELRDETPSENINPEGSLEYYPVKNILIQSGGYERGDLSSIMIDDVDYSPNQEGLNIVVYDYEKGEVVDTAFFNTHDSVKRIADIGRAYRKLLKENTIHQLADLDNVDDRVRKLYLYNRRYHNQQYTDYWNIYGDEKSIFSYLDPYIKNSGYTVFLSVKDEAALHLTQESKEAFAQLGLQELSELATRDCYIGILKDGEVYHEQKALDAEPLVYQDLMASVTSGGFESGNVSSVLIRGQEYSPNERGLNVVIYDDLLEQVVSSAVFDTHEIEPSTSLDLSVLTKTREGL